MKAMAGDVLGAAAGAAAGAVVGVVVVGVVVVGVVAGAVAGAAVTVVLAVFVLHVGTVVACATASGVGADDVVVTQPGPLQIAVLVMVPVASPAFAVTENVSV